MNEVGQRCANTPTRDHPATNRMMTTLNRATTTTASGMPLLQRHPQRICITVSWALHQRLINASDHQGRSLSNLAAHLLELSCPSIR